MLIAGIDGLNDEQTAKQLENKITNFENAKVVELSFISLPHNENYELDLHRPYIDEIKLICDCGNNLTRTKRSDGCLV